MGVQLLLTALQYDFQAVPRLPIHPRLLRTFFHRPENLERIERRVRNGRS